MSILKAIARAHEAERKAIVRAKAADEAQAILREIRARLRPAWTQVIPRQ